MTAANPPASPDRGKHDREHQRRSPSRNRHRAALGQDRRMGVSNRIATALESIALTLLRMEDRMNETETTVETTETETTTETTLEPQPTDPLDDPEPDEPEPDTEEGGEDTKTPA